MKKIWVALGVLIIITGAAVASLLIINQRRSTQNESLKIALNPWIGNGLFYVAQEKGFFSQEHINVDLTSFEDGATGKQLIATNKADVIPLTPETAVVLHDAGISTKTVAMSDTSEGADGILATSDIKTLADLKGKSVAYEVGSPSHFLLSYLLDQAGLSTSDLTTVNTAAPDAGASFVAGNVPAAVTWEPWLSKASDRQGGHLLASSKSSPVLPTLIIVRTDVLNQRPSAIKAMLRALFATQAWIDQNKPEAVSIIAKHFNITDKDVTDQLPTFHWFTYQENIAGFETGQYSAHNLIQTAGDLWLKLGLTSKPVNATDMIDGSLLKNLYK